MSFQLVPARQLPSVDLSRTLLSCVVSVEINAFITQWIRRHVAKLAWCNRIGIVGIIVGFFVPRSVGAPLMVVCTASCLVGMMPTVVLLNVPLLLLLVRQYDFWVFSLFNAVNWNICAILIGDLRAFGCFTCWLNTTLIICIDANTRTLTTFVRGAALWLPGIVVITVSCVFRLFDIDGRHYKPLPLAQHDDDDGHHHLSLTLVNLFANVSITISIYVGLRCYFKREVLSSRFRQRRMIPSSIFRINLALEAASVALNPKQLATASSIPAATAVTARRMTTPVLSTRRQPLKRFSSSIWRSVRVFAEFADPAWNRPSARALCTLTEVPATSLSAGDIQQMQLIRPRVTNFSSDDTFIRGLNGPSSDVARFVVALSGSVGLIMSVYGLTTQIRAGVASIVGLVLSVAFISAFLANCNRRMLWSLARNFDALYVSFQACASAASVGASLQERDARVLSIASLLLWMHLTLALDALLPDARHRLGLKKRYFALPLFGAVVLNLLLMHNTLTGSSVIVPVLENRVVFCLDDDEFCIYTLSFLLMRLVSLLFVLLRLLWVLATQRDNELTFFRGRVEFCSPTHRLPFEFADMVASSSRIAAVILPDTEQQGGNG